MPPVSSSLSLFGSRSPSLDVVVGCVVLDEYLPRVVFLF